jgi:hypothetical protein
VLRFLEVDDGVTVDVTEANPTVRMRSQRMDTLVHDLSVGQGRAALAVKRALKLITPRGLRRGALRRVQRSLVVAEPPPEDTELMLEIRRRYEPEVRALSDYLGRDLTTLWGYDRLA